MPEKRPTPHASKTGDVGHNHALDGLRFFAFLLVFFFHALQKSPWGNWPIIRFGYLGVPIFFVLSGFLIGGILLDLRDKHRPGFGLAAKLKTFYIRRALRIFPVYYLFIGILALLLAMSGRPDPVARDSFFWHLAYLTNFRSFFAGMDNIRQAHFWSLAVEEHFYLLAPLVVLLARPRTLAGLLASIIAAVAVARYAIYATGSARDFWVLSPMQFDLLGLGIATAIIERKGSCLGIDARRLRMLGLLSAVFFVLFVRRFYLGRPGIGIWYATFGPLSLGVATAALVLTLWQRPTWLAARFLALRPFAYFGQISYGLYLFHPNCLGWSEQYYGKYNLPNTFVGLVATLAVAMLSWHTFEKPINNLKNRFHYAGKHRAPKAPDEPSLARVPAHET
ncbi:MAG: acyltransferase [Deltaproteobacteria bacterium]|jgi:peptidoglycan/LPS O-acetylase OafA/YrhL|nr:acyltransferase [Deltaproteobacteria bacterium]